MKFNKFILGLVAVGVMFTTSAVRANNGDLFESTRTYVLAAPQNIGVNGGVGLITNGPIDHLKFSGRVKIDFLTSTNTGTTGGTLTATVYTSPDQTNLTALANYALIRSATTENITNLTYGGTNLYAGNSILLPGTKTTPVASSSFWTTTYLAPLPFTNSGAITLNGNNTVQIGFNADDQARYIYVVYTAGGTVTNFTTSAILTGLPAF